MIYDILIASLERVTTLLTMAFPYLLIGVALCESKKELMTVMMITIVLNLIPTFEKIKEVRSLDYIYKSGDIQELCSAKAGKTKRGKS